MNSPRLFLLAVLALATARAAAADSEPAALAVLQSAASPAEQEAACLRLKQIGTAKSVPVLKRLLADDALALHAISALETLPGPAADDALLSALSTTNRETKAEALHALGVRQVTRAIPAAVDLLSDRDAPVASAAAQALGNLGGPKALAALRKAYRTAAGPVRTAVTDALLACAEKRLVNGDPKGAAQIYGPLRVATEPAQVRAAAFHGLVLSRRGRGAALVTDALRGNDAAEQSVAVQLVRELPDAKATALFADTLPQLAPGVQIALLEALSQRGDAAAAPAVEQATRTDHAEVRIAALEALGELGGAAHVRYLATRAVSGPPAERAAARAALVTLHRDDVLGAILAATAAAPEAEKIELIQALARRGERGAVPQLLRWAGDGQGRPAVASCQALGKLAGDAHADALVSLIRAARSEDCRAAAVAAFVAASSRSRNPARFGEIALKSLSDTTSGVRCALLEAAGPIGGPNVLDALRAALQDADPAVRRTALRVMADNAEDAARPDLLNVARQTTDADARSVALTGYWRLVEGMTGRPEAERLAAVRDGLAAVTTSAELKAALARLGELSGAAALRLAEQYRNDPAARAEAEAACFAIATRLGADRLAEARAALDELAQRAGNARVRRDAGAFLAVLDAQAGFVAPWLVSGPYRQDGREARELFDIPFAPELPSGGPADWRPLPAPSSLTNAWRADLDAIVGGNHCVVYLKARVFCPVEQPVRLELGSDDGVKLWVNGDLVHANNVVRGFAPGQDVARGALKPGWNDFLLKITQHTAGCAAAVRVLAADGRPIPELRFQAIPR
jgi:HEAT repeat protein